MWRQWYIFFTTGIFGSGFNRVTGIINDMCHSRSMWIYHIFMATFFIFSTIAIIFHHSFTVTVSYRILMIIYSWSSNGVYSYERNRAFLYYSRGFRILFKVSIIWLLDLYVGLTPDREEFFNETKTESCDPLRFSVRQMVSFCLSFINLLSIHVSLLLTINLDSFVTHLCRTKNDSVSVCVEEQSLVPTTIG